MRYQHNLIFSNFKKILIIGFAIILGVDMLPNQGIIEEFVMKRVAANPEREVCGFLLSDGDNINEIYFGIGGSDKAVMPLQLPIDNASANCCTAELMKRGVVVQKMLPCRKGMPFLITYHSHPGGDVMPSNEDIKKAFFSKYLLGMALLNFGFGLHKLKCFEVICTPDGRFNWWRTKKIRG